MDVYVSKHGDIDLNMDICGSFVFLHTYFVTKYENHENSLFDTNQGVWACVFSEYIFCDKKIEFRKSLFYGSYMTILVYLWAFLQFLFLVTFFHDNNMNTLKHLILRRIWHKYAQNQVIFVFPSTVRIRVMWDGLYVLRFRRGQRLRLVKHVAAEKFLPGKYFQAQSDLSRDAYRHVFGICLHLDFCVW